MAVYFKTYLNLYDKFMYKANNYKLISIRRLIANWLTVSWMKICTINTKSLSQMAIITKYWSLPFSRTRHCVFIRQNYLYKKFSCTHQTLNLSVCWRNVSFSLLGLIQVACNIVTFSRIEKHTHKNSLYFIKKINF